MLVPLKALVLNILSLSATFGAMVWIFQDGNLSGLLGFTATGTLDTTMPILMFCIAFGLSMDYEVFLLSRIKEEHDRTGDNDASVALGLRAHRPASSPRPRADLDRVPRLRHARGQPSSRCSASASPSPCWSTPPSCAAMLVPAFMRLAGDANWWAPRWMKRIYERAGMSESAAEALLDLTDGGPADGAPSPVDEGGEAGAPVLPVVDPVP